MEIRQEQVVFAGAVLLVGWLVVSSLDSGPVKKRGPPRAAGGPGPSSSPASTRRRTFRWRCPRNGPPAWRRAICSPNRATRGRCRRWSSLRRRARPSRPCGRRRFPGRAPRPSGRFLRAPSTPEPTPVPGLFLEADDTRAAGGVLEGLAAAVAEEDLSSAQRAAQLAGWKKLYDWIRIHQGTPLFGTIRNDDRFGLRANGDAILFVEVDPATGLERFPGQEPVAYERERVLEFDFADTIQNRIREQAHELREPLTPGQVQPALELAEWCIEKRLEAPDALAVAERLYRAAARSEVDDPAPRLGLARCLEAGFRFEEAYAEYHALLEEFEHRAEVHVGLAELEARFRLFESAEARFETALRLERASWRVRWPVGRFLLERGRPAEALPHLEEAYKREPSGEARAARARIRYDLGQALLALGRAEEALESFERAQQADPDWEPAAAAAAGAAILLGRADSVAAPQEAGFALLLSAGLADLERGDFVAAERNLRFAAAADPLRAAFAWRALSWLAEQAGYPDEAQRWIDQAHEADPTDPWTLYQRGRLLAARGDGESAAEMLRAALDRELDFVDALTAMGELLYEAGEHAAAERYLARALELDGEQADVHTLRAINLVELGDIASADASFRAALAQRGDDPAASAGLAWCTYRSDEARPGRAAVRRPRRPPARRVRRGSLPALRQRADRAPAGPPRKGGVVGQLRAPHAAQRLERRRREPRAGGEPRRRRVRVVGDVQRGRHRAPVPRVRRAGVRVLLRHGHRARRYTRARGGVPGQGARRPPRRGTRDPVQGRALPPPRGHGAGRASQTPVRATTPSATSRPWNGPRTSPCASPSSASAPAARPSVG